MPGVAFLNFSTRSTVIQLFQFKILEVESIATGKYLRDGLTICYILKVG